MTASGSEPGTGYERAHAPISVLMSTYESEKPRFLHAALESCVRQELQPAQIVLVLDGPIGAEQRSVIDEFRDRARQAGVSFTVVPLDENAGLGTAMNVGLPHCTQPYVARMDSDDCCDSRRFAAQWAALSADPGIDLLASWQAEFETDPSCTVRIKTVPEHHDDIVRVLRWRNAVPHPSIVFKRDLVSGLGGYHSVLYLEDYDLFMRLVRAGARLHAIQEPLIHVRVSPHQRRRRGGWTYLCRDVKFRLSLYRHGDISLANCLVSVACYAAFRLTPAALKSELYKTVRRAVG